MRATAGMEPPAKGTGVTGLSSQSLIASKTYIGAWTRRATASPPSPIKVSVPVHWLELRKMLEDVLPASWPDQLQERGATSTASAVSLRTSGDGSAVVRLGLAGVK